MWQLRRCWNLKLFQAVILLTVLFTAIINGEDKKDKYINYRDLEADTVKKYHYNDKMTAKDLQGKATVHLNKFAEININNIKNRLTPNKLKKQIGKSNLILSSKNDSILMQINTSKNGVLNIVIDQIVDLDSPEYSNAKDTSNDSAQFIWCHVNSDTLHKFLLTLSSTGIHGSIPIPGSKDEIHVMPIDKNKHMIIETTPNMTNPEWGGQ